MPAIASEEFFAGTLYWFIPLLFYLLNMYVIAFSSESLGILVFPMAISLHPFVAIPMVIGIRYNP